MGLIAALKLPLDACRRRAAGAEWLVARAQPLELHDVVAADR